MGVVPGYDQNSFGDAPAPQAGGVLGVDMQAPPPIQGALADPPQAQPQQVQPSQPQGVLADDGSAAPTQQPSAQPASPMSDLPTPPTWGKRGIVGDVLDRLFLHGTIERTRADQYQERLADYNQQMARRQYAYALNLAQQVQDPEERAAALANPIGYLKNITARSEPRILKPEETVTGGIGGPTYTAPKIITDNGRVGVATPAGYSELGNTGPSMKVEGNVGYDQRGIAGTKPQFTVSSFNKVGASEHGEQQTPLIFMGNSGAPTLGGPAAPTAAPSPAAPGTVTSVAGSGQPGALAASASAGSQGAQNASSMGLRLNNPGLVKALPNGQKWVGQTGVDPKTGYAQFDTLENGALATMKNLHAKQALHGLNTVAGVIGDPQWGWAPASDGNNTGSYVNFVSQQLGVKPDQPLDMNDPQTVAKFARAIFQFENGGKAFSQSPLAGGPAQNAPAPAPTRPVPVAMPGGQQVTLPRTGQQPNTMPSVSGGAMAGPEPRMLSANEVAALGLPPGTVAQYGADGKLAVVSPRDNQSLPKEDADRVNDIKTQAAKMARLAQLGQQFIQLQAKHKTGGLHAIPGVADIEGATNATASEMNSLTKEMIPLQREVGSGPIRIGEIQGPGGGIWGGDVPRMQAPGDANKFSQKNWQAVADQMHDYANFADQWAKTHATLNGMDAAWAKQNGGSVIRLPDASGSAPVRLSAQNPDADYNALAPGALYIGPDGVTRRK